MKSPRIGNLLLPALLLLGVLPALKAGAAETQLQTDQAISTAGYFHLTWKAKNPDVPGLDDEYVVEQSRTPTFEKTRILYRGSEKASLISGLSDGLYYYRVRQKHETNWSKPIRVEVRHHSLATALQFFGLGLLVFMLTLLTILRGIKQTRS